MYYSIIVEKTDHRNLDKEQKKKYKTDQKICWQIPITAFVTATITAPGTLLSLLMIAGKWQQDGDINFAFSPNHAFINRSNFFSNCNIRSK